MKRWREPGRGSAPAGRRFTIGFDDDTTDQVRALAKLDRVSVSEKVRQLVEWGLEAVKQPEGAERVAARSQDR